MKYQGIQSTCTIKIEESMFGKKINSKMLSGANSAYSLMTVDSYIRKDYKTD